MINRPSQLSALDLSDDRSSDPVLTKLNEARRELIAAYERIDQSEGALRGLLCLLRQIGGRPDVSAQLREVLITHPYIIDAQEILL